MFYLPIWLSAAQDQEVVMIQVAFHTIFKSSIFIKLWTEKITEFNNKEIKVLCIKHCVDVYSIDPARFEETRVFLDHWDHTMMGKMNKYFKAK